MKNYYFILIKLSLVILCIFLNFLYIHADTILLNNGDKFEAKILQINPKSVEYSTKEFPLLVLDRSKIKKIIPKFEDKKSNNRQNKSQFDENNNWNSRFSFVLPMLDFQVEHEPNVGEVNYKANIPLSFKSALFFKNYGLSFTIPMNSTRDNEDLYGKTNYYDFQLYFYFSTFAFDIMYQNYDGYYLKDAPKLGVTDPNEIKRADINTKNIALNIYYIFSNDFPLESAFNQIKKFSKFQYSFLIMVSFNQFLLRANKTLIPISQQIYYSGRSDIEGGQFSSISLAPGIALILPILNFYISTAMSVGFGAMYQVQDFTDSSQDSNLGSTILVNWRGSAGYNGDNFFGGLSFAINSVALDLGTNSGSIQTFPGFVEFFCGIRF